MVALAAAAGYAFVASQAGVDFAVRTLVARSAGALAIEHAEGSLLDTVRVRRLVWRGPEASVVAQDIALTWSPAALWSRGLVVRGLGVRTLAVEFKAADTAADLPASLALPFEVTIDRLAVGELAWRVRASRGVIHGVEFGYVGGAASHRVDDLTLVTMIGTIKGNASIGTTPPFAIAGRLAAQGDANLRGADASVALGGTLAAMTADGRGRWGAARATARASLALLAPAPLVEAVLDIADLDLAEHGATLPSTRLAGTLRVQPTDDGYGGTVDATNTTAGSIDAGKLPLATLGARFTLRADTLALDDLVATLTGGGKLAGKGIVPLDVSGTAGTWSLDVRDVDLKAIYAPLVASRLSGRLAADLDRQRQRLSGEVADRTIIGGLALDFAASLADDTVTVERFRARAGTGELKGRARVALAGERAFDLDATATRVDPARLATVPAGTLDGRVAAAGTLAPKWQVRADVTLARGSRLAGVALAGRARGVVAADAIRDAAVELAIGRTRLGVDGSTGAPGDRLAIALDAPELAELAPLLPASVPRAIAGSLHAKAELRDLPPHGAMAIEATGTKLRLGKSLGAGHVEARVNIEAATHREAGTTGDFANRTIRFAAAATELETPSGRFTTMRGALDGKLGRHALTLALTGDDLDVEATAQGGLVQTRVAAGATAMTWTGTLATLENRGAWALRLTTPAPLEVARGRVRVGKARIAIADGGVRLAELAWEDGRISTQGSFAAVPLATVARLAGVTLPFVSTLTLGGEWSLAAAPRLNGSVSVRREGGDLWLVRSSASDPAQAAGVTQLEATAQFSDDALDATATFRSTRNGAADATLALGTVVGTPPGRVAPGAPLALNVTGEIKSLQLLQPWIGTAFAVDGRVRIDLAARGTLEEARLSGTLVGEGLRIDAPQYGLHFTDGKLRARAAGGRVIIDEIALHAGAGAFRASGEITELAPGGARPSGRLAWQAERFRVFNRPDLRLVVGGEGTVTTASGKLSLAGRLKADEGRFVYLATPDSTPGDDVVVKGWPRRTSDGRHEGDIALGVDLAVDLGDNLTFSGEGLEAGLAGEVRVTTGPTGLLGKGSIRAVNGTYFAFGRRLTIERGRLAFDGRLDNPGLDIVALRKNLPVEAGVAVTGTVKVPVIQLTSSPPVSDGEKLSWLVLGHGLDRGTTGTDYAALQAASAALLDPKGKPLTTTIAQSIGLDDISLKSVAGPARSGSGSQGTAGQVVAVGKRLSDSLTLVYEQGLTVATNALRLEYELTQSLTLRAEAGAISGFGIYFRRSFD